jgi:hypothetical protein
MDSFPYPASRLQRTPDWNRDLIVLALVVTGLDFVVQWPLGTQAPDHACFRAGPHSLALPEAINKLRLNHMFFIFAD